MRITRIIGLVLFIVTLYIAAFAQNPAAIVVHVQFATTGTTATGWKVSRSTTAGGPYALIATINNITQLTHADTTGTTGTRYYYTATSFNIRGDSPRSPEASEVFPSANPPDRPGVTLTLQ